MIPGVEVIELTTHIDDRGYFREVLKSSQLPKFGQWSMSYMYQGVIKGFHLHLRQVDYWYVVRGTIKAVLVDCRRCNMQIENNGECFPNNPVSPSEIEKPYEFVLGDNQPPKVLVIPPGVAHGLKVLQGPAVLMYVTSEEYNPKDEGRIPYNSLGYDWFKQDIK